ncbi:O-succinylbenzoic acid--CoA ligase [Maribacter sp. MJ134]|uniref:AMP-binding protein n=1 Tax=Maribacter sp. MJ134 TaxID=2496865 RepID=UPI000F82E4CC|nr:AMP-binding protein [Maribacter sp. MJ134]AZQ58436.1 O-succinylbenzoic acid--CoA ligase [Maribacter sp. MJ134]
MNSVNVHPNFALNGLSCTEADLTELSYSYVKEGSEFEKKLGDFLLDWLQPSHEISVQTSGSTGTPKRISILKEHMINSAVATGDFFVLKPKDTVLHCLPMTYIAGKMLMVRALVLGLHIDVIEPKSSPLTSDGKKYSFSAMVPLQLQNSVNFIDSIEKLIVGGAPFSQDLKNLVQDKRCQIYETYGMTETITHIAARKVNGAVQGDSRSSALPFKVLPKVKISTDQRNCLVIDAPHISEETVYTNDIVELTSTSEFLWLGRHDNVINSGGIKLFPEQIESALSAFINNRFFVAGKPDRILGEKLVLIVEGKLNREEVLMKIRRSGILGNYQIPKEVIMVPKFKETENGKIMRKETVKLLGN